MAIPAARNLTGVASLGRVMAPAMMLHASTPHIAVGIPSALDLAGTILAEAGPGDLDAAVGNGVDPVERDVVVAALIEGDRGGMEVAAVAGVVNVIAADDVVAVHVGRAGAETLVLADPR